MTLGLSKLAWAAAFGFVACNGGGGKGSPDDSAPVGDDDDDDTTEPTAVEVFVNEVMAQNSSTLEDETGAFPDWIELYNAGSEDVDLEGYWLTDDVQNVFKWRFPPDAAVIEAGGYLVVFCDQDTADGPLHASFELGGLDGEDVALFGENVDDNPLIDKIEDMALARPDTSVARMPDGGPTISEDGTATPGASNE